MSQSLPLLLPQLARRNRGELVGPRFPHQDGDFIVRRPAPALCYEGLNGPVALAAALAELCEQFRGDASNLETGISPPCVPLILDFLAERSYLAPTNCGRLPKDMLGVHKYPMLAAPSSGPPCRRTSG